MNSAARLLVTCYCIILEKWCNMEGYVAAHSYLCVYSRVRTLKELPLTNQERKHTLTSLQLPLKVYVLYN